MSVPRFLLGVVAALLVLAAPAQAHEVRPAYLEIVETADGRADVLWKQPSQGQLVLSLTPHIGGGLLDAPPGTVQAAPNSEIRRWLNIDLRGEGLDGREVRVDGLEQTITDVLVLVRLKNGDETQQILTPTEPSFRINARTGVAVPAYLTLGIEHILTGIDHLLFVFGLMLLCAGLRALVKTITAFTVAHSLTLAATALGLLSVNPQLIEAMVAFSILFLAVELVHQSRGRGGITARYPWLIAFGFGLLHGSAFAGALKQIGLPEGNIPLSLFLFNIGVELGQLLFIAAVASVIWLLRRFSWQGAPQLARAAATYGIGSFSMFWFLERLHTALG